MILEKYRLTLTHYMVNGDGEKTMIDEPITSQVVVAPGEYLRYHRSVVVNEMLCRLKDYMLSEITKEEEKI